MDAKKGIVEATFFINVHMQHDDFFSRVLSIQHMRLTKWLCGFPYNAIFGESTWWQFLRDMINEVHLASCPLTGGIVAVLMQIFVPDRVRTKTGCCELEKSSKTSVLTRIRKQDKRTGANKSFWYDSCCHLLLQF